MVLSMIAALGLTVKSENIHCEKLEAKSAGYIVRMGLFKILNIPTNMSVSEHAPEGRFIQLTQIKTSGQQSKFITEMVPLLHLDKEPEQREVIVHIVSELVRNVLEHAKAPNGAIICAQYFKKKNKIRIGIADTGVGIKATISRVHAADTDLEAIRLALMPGITGTTTKAYGTGENAGAGLFFIKAIADVNRDFFSIYSGNGFFKLLKKKSERLNLNADPFEDRHSKGKDFPHWRGTCVGIDISLDQTREFSIILKAIFDAYVKLKNKQVEYKKPRFS